MMQYRYVMMRMFYVGHLERMQKEQEELKLRPKLKALRECNFESVCTFGGQGLDAS